MIQVRRVEIDREILEYNDENQCQPERAERTESGKSKCIAFLKFQNPGNDLGDSTVEYSHGNDRSGKGPRAVTAIPWKGSMTKRLLGK